MSFVSWLSKISFFQTFFSLSCPETPYFTRVFWVVVICSKNADYCKSTPNLMRCCVLIVNKNWLLLSIYSYTFITGTNNEFSRTTLFTFEKEYSYIEAIIIWLLQKSRFKIFIINSIFS